MALDEVGIGDGIIHISATESDLYSAGTMISIRRKLVAIGQDQMVEMRQELALAGATALGPGAERRLWVAKLQKRTLVRGRTVPDLIQKRASITIPLEPSSMIETPNIH